MNTTPASLLERLRQPDVPDAWDRFVKLYTPLLYFWARRLGMQQSDAADLVQEVLIALVQKLPQFHYDKDRSFRNWLRTMMHNKWRDRARRHEPAGLGGLDQTLDELPAPEDLDSLSETEYREHLVGRALHLMRTSFSPNVWRACWEHVVSGRAAAAVAAELGMSVGAVYMAKSRVLCHLRRELQGLLD